MMDSNKWLASVIATLIAIFTSWGVGEMFSYGSFVFAWSLNFILMSWYTYLASQVNLKLDSDYFEPKPIERNGSIYKYLGVQAYRKTLVWIGWEKINKKKNPIKNSLLSLKVNEYNTRASELGHTIIALIVFAIAIGVSSSLGEAKWLILTNLFLNIYPIMVQRFNRPRYSRIIGLRRNINVSKII
ncbi:glycosyl-4,4'-diaponeurosporenoate acyltransferase CrtO family protein [Pontibacter rugosus]|uniref:Glycosyl-4,4'-diaponeurosporenoate acyltransferase n=1 Tax=Pontibacter rugosus TaxID=1745966 RepID=A0ABW3SUC2_9BACT